MSRFPKYLHIVALGAALCCLGVVAIRRHIEHWPVIELIAFLAAGFVIATLVAIIRSGLTSWTPAKFSASIATVSFYIWTGGRQFSGWPEIPKAGVLLTVAALAWLATWCGVRVLRGQTKSTAEQDGGGQPATRPESKCPS